VQYCLAWARLLDEHHRVEEEGIFPAVGRRGRVRSMVSIGYFLYVFYPFPFCLASSLFVYVIKLLC
jgi:hypothetical protein